MRRKIQLGEIVRVVGKTGKLVKATTKGCSSCCFNDSHTCPTNSEIVVVECSEEDLEFEDVIPVKGDKIIVIGVTEVIAD